MQRRCGTTRQPLETSWGNQPQGQDFLRLPSPKAIIQPNWSEGDTLLPHIAAAMLGLAAVLHASAVAFAAVKYAGVAYLLFMAWNALNERGSLAIDKASTRRSDLRVVVDAAAVNLLNPKLSIFFVAFLPQFVGAGEAHPLIRMGELSAAFMLATFVVFALYGVFAAAARRHVLD